MLHLHHVSIDMDLAAEGEKLARTFGCPEPTDIFVTWHGINRIWQWSVFYADAELDAYGASETIDAALGTILRLAKRRRS